MADVTMSPLLTDEQVVELAARSAHEANRAYCKAIGDNSHVPWDEAEDWQKESARAGARQILNDPATTPSDSHDSWYAMKEADGWVYGEVKDVEAKTHPCMVPYDELPMEQKAKDYIFGGIVRAVFRAILKGSWVMSR